jgi:hypothetical protein
MNPFVTMNPFVKFVSPAVSTSIDFLKNHATVIADNARWLAIVGVTAAAVGVSIGAPWGTIVGSQVPLLTKAAEANPVVEKAVTEGTSALEKARDDAANAFDDAMPVAEKVADQVPAVTERVFEASGVPVLSAVGFTAQAATAVYEANTIHEKADARAGTLAFEAERCVKRAEAEAEPPREGLVDALSPVTDANTPSAQ